MLASERSRSLIRGAELLLLVDDHQAEIGKGDLIRSQGMSTDDDRGATLGDSGPYRPGVLRRDQPRELLDLDVRAGKPALEGLEMLLGQHRRRRADGDLPTAQRHGRRRPQRDFGFPEADVAADQSIHRMPGSKVSQDGADCGALVRCLRIPEPRGELGVGYGRGRYPGAGRGGAHLGDLHKAGGGKVQV